MTAIHHFIPTLLKGDGTGNNARAMAQRINELGIDSDFFVQEDKTGEGHRHYSEYPKLAKPGDILVYHLATASEIPAFLASRAEPVVVVYQNLTPARYFERYDTLASVLQRRGKEELALLADKAIVGIAPSSFNCGDLEASGFREVIKVPIIFDPADFMGRSDDAADAALARPERRGFSSWLFVGRLVPNKAQERLIMALHAHRELYGDNVILHLVGRPSYPSYVDSLYELTVRLRLQDRVNFVMGVTPAELASFYRASTLFISASEHEGFCMPIVEALFHGLPVVAYDATAVPETLGIGGVHIKDRDPVAMATWAEAITSSAALRKRLLGLAKARLDEVSPVATIPLLDAALKRILEITDSPLPNFAAPSSLAIRSQAVLASHLGASLRARD